MLITRHIVAKTLGAYLSHQLSLSQLVAWAEQQMMDGDFESSAVRDSVAKLGLADVRSFGLTWDDCQTMLHELGFEAQVNIVAA